VSARVALAQGPRDRFIERIRVIRERIDRLPEDAVAQVAERGVGLAGVAGTVAMTSPLGCT